MKRTTWIAVAILAALVSMLVVSSAAGQRMEGTHSAGIFDYEVTNDYGIVFADEYERLGGVDTLGYPASYRYIGSGGAPTQLTQAAVLQWSGPKKRRVELDMIFERFRQRDLDDWLYDTKGIPRSLDDGVPAGQWARREKVRLSWLTNERIKEKYLANPNPVKNASWSQDQAIRLYGLPMSYPERHGPFISQRFQRVAFQLWVEEVEGMPAPGTVVRVLGGDLFKEAGLLSWRAWSPEERPRPMARAFPDLSPDPPTTAKYGHYWGGHATTVIYGDYFGDHWITVAGGLNTGRYGAWGPYLNLYFPEEFVGRKLTIRQFGFACKKNVKFCGPHYTMLYRSLVGPIEPGRGYRFPALTPRDRLEFYARYGLGEYDAELVAGGRDYTEIVWEIESPGVYFVFFGKEWNFVSGIRYYSSGEERPAYLPPLITYTVSVE